MASTASRTPSRSPQWSSSFGTISTIHWWSTMPHWTWCSPTLCPASSRLVNTIALCSRINRKTRSLTLFKGLWIAHNKVLFLTSGERRQRRCCWKKAQGGSHAVSRENEGVWSSLWSFHKDLTGKNKPLKWALRAKFQLHSKWENMGGPEFFLIGCIFCDAGDPDEADSNWGLQWDNADLRGAVSRTGTLRRGVWAEQSVRGGRQRSGEVLNFITVKNKSVIWTNVANICWTLFTPMTFAFSR